MKPKSAEAAWSYAVAATIREVLYAPDGKPEQGWAIGRDLRIAKAIMVRMGLSDLDGVIRGLRVLYPKGKLTLKLVTARKSKEGYPLALRALEAFRGGGGKRAPSNGMAKLSIQIGRPTA